MIAIHRPCSLLSINLLPLAECAGNLHECRAYAERILPGILDRGRLCPLERKRTLRHW